MEAMELSFELRELLIREYFELQSILQDYTSDSLTIKGWSVTVGFAALVAVYTRPAGQIGRVGVALAGCSAIPFLLLDALWRSYQLAYYSRLCALEMALSGDHEKFSRHCIEPPAETGPEIFRAWVDTVHAEEMEHIWIALTSWSVLLPHVVVIFAGIGLAVFLPPKEGSRR